MFTLHVSTDSRTRATWCVNVDTSTTAPTRARQRLAFTWPAVGSCTAFCIAPVSLFGRSQNVTQLSHLHPREARELRGDTANSPPGRVGPIVRRSTARCRHVAHPRPHWSSVSVTTQFRSTSPLSCIIHRPPGEMFTWAGRHTPRALNFAEGRATGSRPSGGPSIFSHDVSVGKSVGRARPMSHRFGSHLGD